MKDIKKVIIIDVLVKIIKIFNNKLIKETKLVESVFSANKDC